MVDVDVVDDVNRDALVAIHGEELRRDNKCAAAADVVAVDAAPVAVLDAWRWCWTVVNPEANGVEAPKSRRPAAA